MKAKRKSRAVRVTRPRLARRPNVTAAELQQFAGLFPGGTITPAILKKVGREYKKVSNPGRGAFERCVRSVAASGTAASPRGVCAAAGRKKYGAKKFQAMAAAGKRRAAKNPLFRKFGSWTDAPRGKGGKRGKLPPKPKPRGFGSRSVTKSVGKLHRKKRNPRNPVDAAAETYEKFHGRPPEEIIEVEETVHEHSVLSGIGKLHSLTIIGVNRARVELSGFGGALLAQNEAGTQLFIKGGDQKVDLDAFGITRPHENEVLGFAVEVGYDTRKDHLGSAGGAGARHIHVHEFGDLDQIDRSDPRRQKGSRLPVVTYDVVNEKLAFVGGGYDLPEVGIRG